ncbi:MarR family winged helix-turn-helix transcriptional regulator [Streptomyces sp. NBC_01602]|uniref:MarR family winged helix-turn-helix transcriptional regulator n=1 Tax=Streptomyces sp. NBC_01602 TaxID=2975893 RepID=UPI00386D42F7
MGRVLTGTPPHGLTNATGIKLDNAALREIEHELAEHHRLSISELDTLVNIPLKGTRLHELKDRVVLTQSAVSRLCDKLADRGLITRSPLEEDARGAMIHLTDAGRKVLRNAACTNAEVVERTFADRLSQTQLESLHEILDQVTEHHPEGCDLTG